MSTVDDIHEATEVLRDAVARLGHTMTEQGLPGDTAVIEHECTLVAQDTTDITGMPLAQSLRSIAKQVDHVHLEIVMGRHKR